MIGSRVFLRSMATATKSVKPPIQLFGVDGTYANALYSASAQDSSIDKTFQALTRINELVTQDPKVSGYLTNPALSKEDRAIVIDTIASNLKLEKPIVNFLTVLSDNNRLGEFSSIYQKFGLLNDAHNGLVEAKITSAKALDSKILKRLQTAISKSSFVGEGKTLKVSNDVNPEILGGLVVEVGDRTVDLSISSKVARLNNALGESL
ncbi:ATP synthase F0 subcomplex subunit OSCP atp5 [Yamadazyma tenuis]|uniref:ATP synthase subunit 5, mitochondrial n=1 Tax=Candida tenuis (strain ATCC 10573 / BCRC 21748 / CBS 615 / JCM 9827 / NBRC 10315 / NRRL Y-1498 / VKM Y-70) TaxID=590646 RepID=G3B9S8_CANTC|nr:F1 complex, OSCP/delta subunit of ATPase [Yamadazyma tenuis ATCC 10573]EGV61959.1 F1 complex, OSCP/delta subunit of ATPase [Yamadazyma tenuis ATCC 10573]WEJ93206.1 ATP synthase F0 subcomplex subunit OSCP atp5 [Yamadazyma tenuis]